MTSLAEPARDASWSERAATLGVFLALGLGVGTWAAALPSLKRVLALSDSDLSLALLALAIGSVLSTILTGIVAPRFGTARATGLAAFATVVTFALPAFAQSLPQLIGCTLVMGVACGGLDVAVNAHASEVERRWTSPIMSSFHAAFSVGGLAGASLGGLLASTGWGVAGQLWPPLALAAVLVVLATPALGAGVREAKSHGTGLVLPERAMIGLCAIALFCFLMEGAVADWSGVYLSTVANASVGAAAAGYAAFSVAMAGGRLVGDWIVAWLGPRRVVLFGGLFAVAGTALAVAIPEPTTASIGFALIGIGLANVVPVTFSAASRIGSTPTAGMAMVATVGYAGFLGGPPLIGAVAGMTGLRGGLALLLVASLVVAVGGLFVERPARKP